MPGEVLSRCIEEEVGGLGKRQRWVKVHIMFGDGLRFGLY